MIWKLVKRSLVVIILLTTVILVYFQLFYKSPRVNSNVAALNTIFTGYGNVVTSVRFIGDSLLVTSSADSNIRIYSLDKKQLVRVLKQPSAVAYMDVSKDGQYIATGGFDSKLRLIKVADGKCTREFTGHEGTIWTVAFNHEGTAIASAGDDKVINIWNTATGMLTAKLSGHKRIVWAAKFSADDQFLASGSFDFTVKLWDLKTGNLTWDNNGHSETVVDLEFSHDGNMLATTSDDKTIKLWDWRNKKLIRTMSVAEHVQAVAFSPDDKMLITGGRDKPMIGEFLQNFLGDSKYNKGVSARLWDVGSGTLLQTFQEHENDVQDVAFSGSGKYIATAGADRTVEVWEVKK